VACEMHTRSAAMNTCRSNRRVDPYSVLLVTIIPVVLNKRSTAELLGSVEQ